VADFQRDVYCILGLPFDAVDIVKAVRCVQEAATHRHRCFISTPNLNFAIGCLADEAFRDSVINSDISTADGMPLVWIARLLGIPIRERVSGAGLFDALRNRSGNRLSVYFFGGLEGAAEAACRRLAAEGRGLACAGFEYPGFGPVEQMSSEGVIRRINTSQADFLVVSLGARKGQAWIERNRAQLTVPVICHLGAVVNYVAGTVDRAPGWMQNVGLEWLWRIKEEPTLWRRYLFDGAAFLKLIVTRTVPLAWTMYRTGAGAAPSGSAAISSHGDADGALVIQLTGAWTRENLQPLRSCFAESVQPARDLRLDLEAVSHADSAFLGLLLLLYGCQKRQGRRLLLRPLNPGIERIIELANCGFLLHPQGAPSRR
jgi:N-acetylglucosaminyldiphosphoundecaprenol N-acetyl-beta-D-mannosaminyltransferase